MDRGEGGSDGQDQWTQLYRMHFTKMKERVCEDGAETRKGWGRVTERTSRAIRLISRAAVVRKSLAWRHKLRLRRKLPFV